jgi:manganese/zinc/iron transport system ATP- binding protein
MSDSTRTALSVRDLVASYDREPVLRNISFEADAGDLMAIVGPNGAGKSTLIKAIVGAHEADSGTIEVLGQTGHAARKDITYVPQRGDIDWDFPVTVDDVVLQGRYGNMGLLGRPSEEDRRLVREAMEMVEVTDLRDRQIGELSGGQQQRVFLARALAQQGQVYLLDEPFVGVDAATEKGIARVMRELSESGRAVLVVHHDLSTVREYFDKVLLMNAELIDYGPTDEVFTTEKLQETYGGELTVLDQSGPAIVA